MKLLLQILILGISFTCVMAHISDMIKLPGLRLPSLDELNTRVLIIESFSDFLWANLYVGAYQYFLYLGIGTILEYTNPAPKTDYRKKMTKKQIAIGLSALVWVIFGTTLYMWKFEQYNYYYGYYATHDFGIKEWAISLLVYALTFDFWFYLTHVLFHHPILWKYIHSLHHEFVEPTAFAQDAVHPLEALIQGPVGHFLSTFIYPQHPAWVSLFGTLTGVYAIFAHDGRWDFAKHNMHHFYCSCNYGLWGIPDYLFRTKYSKAKFPIEYVPTWEREVKRTTI